MTEDDGGRRDDGASLDVCDRCGWYAHGSYGSGKCRPSLGEAASRLQSAAEGICSTKLGYGDGRVSFCISEDFVVGLDVRARAGAPCPRFSWRYVHAPDSLGHEDALDLVTTLATWHRRHVARGGLESALGEDCALRHDETGRDAGTRSLPSAAPDLLEMLLRVCLTLDSETPSGSHDEATRVRGRLVDLGLIRLDSDGFPLESSRDTRLDEDPDLAPAASLSSARDSARDQVEARVPRIAEEILEDPNLEVLREFDVSQEVTSHVAGELDLSTLSDLSEDEREVIDALRSGPSMLQAVLGGLRAGSWKLTGEALGELLEVRMFALGRGYRQAADRLGDLIGGTRSETSPPSRARPQSPAHRIRVTLVQRALESAGVPDVDRVTVQLHGRPGGSPGRVQDQVLRCVLDAYRPQRDAQVDLTNPNPGSAVQGLPDLLAEELRRTFPECAFRAEVVPVHPRSVTLLISCDAAQETADLEESASP